ncbi:MAG: hypothetical protein E7604_01270 [Ruminococcaceae bacterium]|nr:hypothetical protein [Oscillospiraceae bacterium]
MKKWNCRIVTIVLSAMLILTMLLFSCCTDDGTEQVQTDETSGDAAAVPLTDRDTPDARYISEISSYRLQEWPEGHSLKRFGYASFVRGGCYYAEAVGGYAVLDGEGALLRTLSHSMLGSDNVLTFTCNEAEEFLVLTTNGIGVELHRLDEGGSVTNTVSLPGEFVDFSQTVIRTSGDSIYILQANSFAVYDAELCLQKTLYFPGDAYGKMSVMADGTILLGAYAHTLYTVDLAAGAFVPFEIPGLPGALAEAAVHFDTEENLYLADGTGIYSSADGEFARILDWSTGGVEYSTSMDLRIFDEDTVAVFANHPKTFRASFQKLSSFVIRGEPRRVITLGMNCADNDGHIAALVFNFNSTNTRYYIEMFDYNDKYPYNGSNPTYTRDSILEEFLTGGEPDIVIDLGPMMTETLVDKNAFVDLDPYFGDQLLGGVRAASRMNGILPYVPLCMNVTTLVSADETADGYLTMQSLYDAAAQLGAGQYLFSDPYDGMRVYECGIRTFYDTETKQCSFDSAEFCDFIRFTEQIDARYTNTELGYFNRLFVNDPWYTLSDPCVRDRLADGTLRYFSTTIQSAADLAATKYLLGGEHMMCLGYPTGGGAYILPYFEIYITANSDVQGGAAEFVSFALSQEAMTAPTLTRTFLPTTQDAMLALLDQSTYYYYEDDPTAWLPYNQYEGSAAVVSGVYLFHLLDSAVPDMEKALKYSNSGKVKEIVLTAEDKDAFLALLNADGAVSSAAGNTVINAILEEELSAYHSGAKTLEDVAALIQSRVWIYLNE